MEYTMFLITLCSIIRVKTNAELFSSLSKLEPLFETQRSVIETLDNFFEVTNSENKVVKRYLALFKTELQEAMKDIPRYLGNPINSFRLIKRLTADLDYIKIVLYKNIEFDRNKTLIYPTQEEMNGAAAGIERIQFTYQLNTTRLADGKWNTSFGTSTCSSPMSVSDCFELGKAMYNNKLYNRGIEWLKEAASKVYDIDQMIRESNRITLEVIQKEIISGYKGNDNILKEYSQWYHELLALNPEMYYVDRNVIDTFYKRGLTPDKAKEAFLLQKRHNIFHSLEIKELSHEELNKNYLALCRDEIVKQDNITKHLSCYYAHGPHMYLKLAPIKAERLHLNPDFTMYYNVISDAEIRAIQNLIMPKMFRPKPIPANIYDITTDTSVCQLGHAFANESDWLTSVRTRIAQVTSLKLATDEPLRVMNYGIGGHNHMHYDYYTNYTAKLIKDNRLATFNFYFSDVEQGGATVFPALKLAVHPVKGAALFWMNLLPAGQGNPSNIHAGCPVLQGSKWVAVQWINLRVQQFCPKL